MNPWPQRRLGVFRISASGRVLELAVVFRPDGMRDLAMGKSRSQSRPPSQRPGGAQRPTLAQSSKREAETKLPAASEISARMQHLAHQIDHLPIELAKAVSNDDDHHRSSSRATGAEVIDAGLLCQGAKPISAHVVTVDAYPNPENPGGIVVRLDGWEGFLLVNLTRDRAVLLAERLSGAVEKSQDWYGSGR